MKREVRYRREVETALFQGKEITVEHLIPILSPEEKTRRTREIERQRMKSVLAILAVDWLYI